MNGLKCPECGLVNLLNAEVCHRCKVSLKDLGSDAEVSVPVNETFGAKQYEGDQEFVVTETAKRTFFWYRVYVALMTLLYLGVAVLGIVMAVFSYSDTSSIDSEVNMITGVVYAVLGIVFAIVFGLGIIFHRQSFHWVYGIVLIAIGMTSCCTMPATIPLLIFWLKPETKALFNRS